MQSPDINQWTTYHKKKRKQYYHHDFNFDISIILIPLYLHANTYMYVREHGCKMCKVFIYIKHTSRFYGQNYRDLLPITDFWEKYGLFGIRINFKALPRIKF